MARYPRWMDPDTEIWIGHSSTPRTVDGYKPGEPNSLTCAECGASIELTRKRSPGIAGEQTIDHRNDCPLADD